MDDDSLTMQRWTARDEQIAKNGLAMEQWTVGNVTMDGSRWTARRNERLGNRWLGGGWLGYKALDGSAMS